MDDQEKQEQYQALSVFCQKYDPANTSTCTDKFSSMQIQSIVANHTGINIELGDLHNLMTEMKFIYELEDDQFVWLCQKA
jgi:hypothetical protein